MDSSIWHGVCQGSNSREGLQIPSPMCLNVLRRPGTGDGGSRYLKNWWVDCRINASQGSSHSCSSRSTFSPTTHDVPDTVARVHSKQSLWSPVLQELTWEQRRKCINKQASQQEGRMWRSTESQGRWCTFRWGCAAKVALRWWQWNRELPCGTWGGRSRDSWGRGMACGNSKCMGPDVAGSSLYLWQHKRLLWLTHSEWQEMWLEMGPARWHEATLWGYCKDFGFHSEWEEKRGGLSRAVTWSDIYHFCPHQLSCVFKSVL